MSPKGGMAYCGDRLFLLSGTDAKTVKLYYYDDATQQVILTPFVPNFQHSDTYVSVENPSLYSIPGMNYVYVRADADISYGTVNSSHPRTIRVDTSTYKGTISGDSYSRTSWASDLSVYLTVGWSSSFDVGPALNTGQTNSFATEFDGTKALSSVSYYESQSEGRPPEGTPPPV
jgi:hypothetical protein